MFNHLSRAAVLVVVVLAFALAVASRAASSDQEASTHYMPIVQRQPTPTVTPSPTPIPFPLVNGNFESGRTGWTEASSQGYVVILSVADGLPLPPHSGVWLAWLGGVLDDISYVEQRVTVPPGSPYLSYWHWIASQDECGHDFGGVIVNGSTVVAAYDLCGPANTGGWVKYVVNLSAYAGQSLPVQIRSETDGEFNSNLFVDDVGFQSSPEPSAEPEVYISFDEASAVTKGGAGVTGGSAASQPVMRLLRPAGTERPR